jgi:uncharacterized protein YbaA (DUF1428 family)
MSINDQQDNRLDVVEDSTLRFVIDDVSDGARTEFRASVYDGSDELIADAWGATPAEAASKATAEVYK